MHLLLYPSLSLPTDSAEEPSARGGTDTTYAPSTSHLIDGLRQRIATSRPSGNIDKKRAEQFDVLKTSDLKVARAWAIKEMFRGFWDYRYAGWAKRHFDRWYAWAIRSRLTPIKKKAKMIKDHLPNILTYFKHRISNAVAEGLNSKIQTIKANARGYRSFAGFRNSILFYCGGLDMTP